MGHVIAVGTTIVLLVTIIFMPKHLRLVELYTTAFFCTYIAMLADLLFNIKLNLYNFFHEGVDGMYLLIFGIVYPAVNIVFLNFFPYEKPFFKKIRYILAWSVCTMLFELFCLQTDLFHYRGWKWWYSAGLYPLIYTVLYLNLTFTRKLAAL